MKSSYPVRKNKGNRNGRILGELRQIRRRLDMLIIIELASRGLELKEIADILNVSDRTVRRIISIRKIKQGGKHEGKKK